MLVLPEAHMTVDEKIHQQASTGQYLASVSSIYYFNAFLPIVLLSLTFYFNWTGLCSSSSVSITHLVTHVIPFVKFLEGHCSDVISTWTKTSNHTCMILLFSLYDYSTIWLPTISLCFTFVMFYILHIYIYIFYLFYNTYRHIKPNTYTYSK